jgi:hypothetical protein
LGFDAMDHLASLVPRLIRFPIAVGC